MGIGDGLGQTDHRKEESQSPAVLSIKWRVFKYPMTKRRQLVLDFIRAYIKIHGVPPAYETVAKGLGMRSRSNIQRIVHRLQDDGYLRIKPHKFRSIRLVDSSVREMASL